MGPISQYEIALKIEQGVYARLNAPLTEKKKLVDAQVKVIGCYAEEVQNGDTTLEDAVQFVLEAIQALFWRRSKQSSFPTPVSD